MTADEFWKAVGKAFTAAREARGIDYPSKVPRLSANTVIEIEDGNPGWCSKLSEYADRLGVELEDIFRAVVSAAPDRRGCPT